MRALVGALCLAAAVPAARAEEGAHRARPALIPLGGIVLFYDVQGPLSFVSMTRRELPADAVPVGTVKGRACQHGLSVPLSASLEATELSAAAGKGGYRKALERIRGAHPGLRGVYDVKVDLHRISILGIYGRVCTEVEAFGFR
ncbi:MAG: hypothetical protein ABII00_14885 [Elusimicrobiota bacterium]